MLWNIKDVCYNGPIEMKFHTNIALCQKNQYVALLDIQANFFLLVSECVVDPLNRFALPVFGGWNAASGEEGKPPIDSEPFPNASKLAKSAPALVFCGTGSGEEVRFRQTDEQQNSEEKECMNGFTHDIQMKWSTL